MADYGTRQINPDEWDDEDEEDDDPTGLNELFAFAPETDMPDIHRIDLTENDRNELSATVHWKHSLDVDTGRVLITNPKGKIYDYVPISVRRPLFWHIHSPKHESLNYVIDNIKRMGFNWPGMYGDISDYLSHCECIVHKENLTPPYSEKVHIFARRALHLLAIDLFEYMGAIYFTCVDIFSRFYYATAIESKEMNEE